MTMNRVHNVRNPNQGAAKKVLCVCSAGLLRSPTLANILHREFKYNTRAVGVSRDYALIPMDRVHMEWADEIVFVHPDVFDEAQERFGLLPEKTKVLNIQDRFAYADPVLEEACLTQYKETLNGH